MEDAIGTRELAIRATHSTWIDAVNKGDLDSLRTLMMDDVVFVTPGRAPFGHDEFCANFSAAHQQLLIRCTSDLEEVVIVGDVAYTRSNDTLHIRPRAGGTSTKLAGYRMTVYRQRPTGDWGLARDIHTLSTVPDEA